jgi:hypothetical protein
MIIMILILGIVLFIGWIIFGEIKERLGRGSK